MIEYLVLTFVVVYGSWKSTLLWKKFQRSEAIVVCVLSLVAACYLLPVIGNWIPTTETFNTFLYQSISEFVMRSFHIVQEVSPS
ncbi:hypothetical protein A8990_13819 [Paenibacillus taihuensis]|uniref:Uncharacterized protein n=1 Tax=Paenibacillus taihuensis TaxID=1156355 RepID=A0A3D9QV16_9BACL|nr:hypothetical protein [Paenibacillus taihuensis]REE68090.1 hypothetical protein A8990_13819 [Paenibacillus taihuensis]